MKCEIFISLFYLVMFCFYGLNENQVLDFSLINMCAKGATFLFFDVPEEFQMTLQDPATGIMEALIDFHHDLIFFFVIIVTLVFWLLWRLIFLFEQDKVDFRVALINAIYKTKLEYTAVLPMNFSKNLVAEIIWTIIPFMILLYIMPSSFSLLYAMDDMMIPSVTMKCHGHQWFWNYNMADTRVFNSSTPVNLDNYIINENDELDDVDFFYWSGDIKLNEIPDLSEDDFLDEFLELDHDPLSLDLDLDAFLEFEINDQNNELVLLDYLFGLPPFISVELIDDSVSIDLDDVNNFNTFLSLFSDDIAETDDIVDPLLNFILDDSVSTDDRDFDTFLNSLSDDVIENDAIDPLLNFILDDSVENGALNDTEDNNIFWLNSFAFDYGVVKKMQKLFFDSYMVGDSDLKPGQFRLLEVDKHICLPLQVFSRLLISAEDVIHSFAIPSLGVKMDAVPGRSNQVGVLIKRLGRFYGQCSEICGANHAFMPIVLECVSQVEFIKWYDANSVYLPL